MRILSRYILREIINPLSIGIFAFTFLFLVHGVFLLMDWVIIGGVSGREVGTLILALMPFLLNITFPMALLLGCVFAFGRLSENNEIQAMMTCGETYTRVIRPVLYLGIACTCFLLFWCEYVSPRASKVRDMALFRIVEEMSPIAVFEEGNFSTRIRGKVLYMQRIDLAEKKVNGVAIFDMQGNKIKNVMFSPEGRIDYDSLSMTMTLALEGGETHLNVETGEPDFLTVDGTIEIVLNCGQLLEKLVRDEEILKSLPRRELKKIENTLLKNDPTGKSNYKKIQRVQRELSNRLVTPFACLVLALAGAPLGFWMQRGSKGACFALSLFVILIYYFLMVLGSSLSERGIISLHAGAWIPNLVIALLALSANLQLARK